VAPPEGTRLALQRGRFDDADFDLIDALDGFAGERGVSILDVAIGGLLAQPVIGSVIAGATSGEQVRRNVVAAAWEPSADDVAALDELTAGNRG
jgi:aryl-alcohol dehydrogenase-like predicted oxidoreductase